MKKSYKLCTSECKIAYKSKENNERLKFERSNISETVVYSISLPIFHVYSMYNYYQRHSINIKNNSTMILKNVHIEISIKNRLMYNLEILKVNKQCNYYRSENSINIKIKTLIPNEELHIKLAGYPNFFRYNLKEIGTVKLNAKVIGIDGNLFTVERIENLNL